MRYWTILFSALLSTASAAATSINVFIGAPQATIPIHLTSYPEFVRITGYPVYYAPRLRYNVFFYDGLYWAFYDDRWYASTWYNGPWSVVDPEAVPLYVLRVPVRYYRAPPAYFSGWAVDAAPRWDVHWGSTWAQQRAGWDDWNRSAVVAAAPLPVYQRSYTGSRYPSVQQQLALQSQQYRYTPRDTVVQQYYRTQVTPARTTAVTQRRTTAADSANTQAPGQMKKQQNVQSAREFAPGQVKKQQNAQSARDFAPGHVKKQQAQPTQAVATTPRVVERPVQPRVAAANVKQPGRDRDRDGDGEPDHGQGHGQGQGHGGGKGKGHNKD